MNVYRQDCSNFEKSEKVAELIKIDIPGLTLDSDDLSLVSVARLSSDFQCSQNSAWLGHLVLLADESRCTAG